MLEHAHARDLVVRRVLGHVAVVEQLHLTELAKPSAGDLGARELILILGKRDPGRVHPVMLGRPDDQRTPPAADVEEALARLQHELLADVIELLLLRELEAVLGAPEVGTRIDAATVEPQAVEIVADVVVIADRLRVESARVGEKPAQLGGRAVRGARRRPGQRFADADDLARLSFDVEIFLDVVARELAHGRTDERREHSRGADRDVHRRVRRRAHALAVPQGDRERHFELAYALFDLSEDRAVLCHLSLPIGVAVTYCAVRAASLRRACRGRAGDAKRL